MAEATDACCGDGVETLIMACAGGSNVGRIIVTDLGIEKNHKFDSLETETAEALEKML